MTVFDDQDLISSLVAACSICTQNSSNNHETHIFSEFRFHPWKKASVDVFKIDCRWIITITDQISMYFENILLKKMQKYRSCREIQNNKFYTRNSKNVVFRQWNSIWNFQRL